MISKHVFKKSLYSTVLCVIQKIMTSCTLEWSILLFITNSRFSNYSYILSLDFCKKHYTTNTKEQCLSSYFSICTNFLLVKSIILGCIFLYITVDFLTYESVKTIILHFVSSSEKIRMRAPNVCCDIIQQFVRWFYT